MSEAPIVTVEQGQLQGRVGTSPNGKTFFSFQGIPYAKPPIGPLRFKAPQPPEPWQGIYNATAEGNIAPQITLESKYVGEDNCLFLNIYSPKLDGADLPVMIVEAHEQMNPTKFTIVKLNYFTVVFEKEFPGVEGFITESFLDLVTSGRIADIPMMIGFCTLEFIKDEQIPDLQFFIPDEFNLKKDSKESLEIVEKFKHLYLKGDHAEGMARLLSDRSIKVDTNRLVKYLVQVTNRPIYFYNFDYVGALNIYDKIMKNPYNHAAHMDDLGYLFKNVFQKDLTISELDNKVRERMLKLWTNFAKFGNPTPDKDYYLPITWQPVDKDNAYYLNIGSELTLQTDVDKEKMDFWDDLYRKYFRIWEQPKTNSDEVIIKYKPPTNVYTVQEPNEIKTAAAPTVSKVNGESSVPKQVDIETNMKGMVIRASDPPEDDLPKNIGVNKFINFYDSLGKNT
ncbi:unnamed protein product [Arctia plantaginis]|uniref:Carboxylesterase type B domain-containing protein n=1 Tax=Arctia plantaginis TaxID=874455 RepID=A0A8S0ZIG5_ARCPL|nr:unnamed protein product [Arctia plantaginis]